MPVIWTIDYQILFLSQPCFCHRIALQCRTDLLSQHIFIQIVLPVFFLLRSVIPHLLPSPKRHELLTGMQC